MPYRSLPVLVVSIRPIISAKPSGHRTSSSCWGIASIRDTGDALSLPTRTSQPQNPLIAIR
ncbi:MAG: hypothetical protein WD042_12715 [Phycisphaeraceae bacterium]